jgi:dTDP-4-amino-4,6-dideoxygalactose transaminase
MSPEEPIAQTVIDNAEVWDAVEQKLKDLVVRGAFTLGAELEEFEGAAARAFDCSWAVGTSSGTSALCLALRAAPVPPGSRIAVPANTFFATIEAVVTAGHIPVVVDHDEDYLCSLDQLGSTSVAGVVPVHLYGLAVDMPSVMRLACKRNLWVLEDCAQAHGATIAGRAVGSFGHAGAFSAYPTKNLGAWGDAGFVTGSDETLERSIRAMRHHGQESPNEHRYLGGTHRMDNLQALVLKEKLERLSDEVKRRRQVAEWYSEELLATGLALPGDRGMRQHAFHQYVIRVSNRQAFRRHLERRGIATAVHYPAPVHLQAGATEYCQIPERPRRAEAWCQEIVSLPMHPGLNRSQVARVGRAVREFTPG